MILTETITVKLETSPAPLVETFSVYTKAFNHICQVGWNSNDRNAVSLHHKTYKWCRQFLPSQLACSVRGKAVTALKTIHTFKKKGKKVSCPQSKQMSIEYDANSYNVWVDRNEISISTVNGRQKFKFKAPPNFNQYSSWKRCSATLYIKNRKVMLGIVFSKEVSDNVPNGNIVGIDRGIKRIAVTSNNLFFGGQDVKRVVNRYRVLRKKLQSVGTRSAKRHLVAIRNKENRFRRQLNHTISKKIANSIPQGTTIVLEDLSNIRANSKKFRKEQRYWINGWSFYQLEQFLSYKLKRKGCFLDFVDARYTSQKCSNCGHVFKGNRINQTIFKCQHCGFQLNADLNAARNIRNNFYQNTISSSGGAAVNQPIVAGSSPVTSC